MKSIINKIALFFVLFDNIFLPIDIGIDFRLNYFVMIGYILYYPIAHRTVLLKRKTLVFILIGLFLVFLTSLLNAISYSLVLKQSLLITVTLVFSYFLINSYKFNLEKIFKDYIYCITVAGVLVIMQFIGIKANMNFLIDYSYLGFDTGKILVNASRGRFHAWFYEPSFMAYAFVPVVFAGVGKLYGIGNLISLRRAVFLIMVLFMAKSSIGLVGLLISLIIVTFSKYPLHKKPIILFFLVFGLIVGSYLVYLIPAVKLRVDQTYTLFTKENVSSKDVAMTNLSTYALYSNFKITQASFKEAPLTGSGIGTYELNYDKHLFNVIPSSNWRNLYKINRQDANSLFFRLVVETGIVGILIFIYFLLKNKLRFVTNASMYRQNLWCINNGVFVLILLRLLRQGHYTMLGFLLMILIYYISRKQANLHIKTNIQL